MNLTRKSLQAGRGRHAGDDFAFPAFNLVGNDGGDDVVDLHAIGVEPFELVVETLERVFAVQQFDLDFQTTRRGSWLD